MRKAIKKIPVIGKVDSSTLSILVALIITCIVFSILSPYFLSMRNFRSIGLYAAIIGCMATGATVVMLMGCLDLSQHAVGALGTILITIFVDRMGLPVGAAIVLALLMGTVYGAFNGFLVAKCGISPMIATMGSQYIARGLCYILTNSKTITFSNRTLQVIGRGMVLGIPNTVLVMFACFFILSYVLNKTVYGRCVYAVGANQNAAFLSGIGPVKTKLIAYVICAVTSIIGGIITVSQLGAAVPSSGVGSEMEIIASVYLGGLAANGGKGGLLGTFLGVSLLCVINNGLTLCGVENYWQTFMRGVVILVAIYVDTLRVKRN
ncbi:MAG: ABC transporter permease [Clostridiales bacterium]|nr:ABC transporter permease [Clostridiales bacterium]